MYFIITFIFHLPMEVLDCLVYFMVFYYIAIHVVCFECLNAIVPWYNIAQLIFDGKHNTSPWHIYHENILVDTEDVILYYCCVSTFLDNAHFSENQMFLQIRAKAHTTCKKAVYLSIWPIIHPINYMCFSTFLSLQ